MLHKPRSPSSALRSSSGCKLERVAGWVSWGIYTAFFTSLDRCSCVKLDTIDMNEPKDQPLLQRRSQHSAANSNGPHAPRRAVHRSSSSTTTRSSHHHKPGSSQQKEDDHEQETSTA